MKKLILLFLSLLTLSGNAQAVFDKGIKITNTTDNAALKVNVQSATGVINTILKTDLQNVIEVASASALPATGAAKVIYVTLDNQLQYRWTGAIYSPYFESKANLSGATFTGPVVVPTATLATQAVNKAQLDILKHVGPTGLNEGGVMTVNTNTSRYDLSAGFGYIVNGHSDPDNPTYTKVTWAAKIANVISNLATQEITYIAIDINGDLFPTNVPLTPTQRRNYIRIGRIVHLNNTSITYINNQPTVNIEVGGQLQDLLEAFGFRSLSGNRLFPAATNLKIKKEVGKVFKSGSNFETLSTQPHSFILADLDPITFKYRTQTGVEGSAISDIDPDIYDVNGTITPVGSTATLATIQRVFVSQSNEVRIQPGQRVFTTLNGAVTAINSDVFVTDGDIFENFLYLGAIVLTRNTVNLADIAQAIFVPSTGVCANGTAPVPGVGYTAENQANKQNNLTPDGTGAKYPTIDAINAGAILNQNAINQVANIRISGSGTFGSSVTATDVNSRINFTADTWHTSSDGVQRFNFVPNSDSYFKSGNNWLFRNSSDANVATIFSDGSASFSSSVTATSFIGLGTSLTGLTKTQVGLSLVPNTDFTSSVSANTAKISFDNTSSTRLANTSGTNTGDQDLSAKSNIASPTFTGTPTAPTAAAGTNTTQIATTAFVLANLQPYKVYTALLSQTGTSAPVATILENTTGAVITWGYSSSGGFTGTSTGLFTVSKTAVLFTNGNDRNGRYDAARISNNIVFLTSSLATTNSPSNDLINNATIEIRVYNFIFLMVPYSMTRRRKRKLNKLIK